MAVSHKGIALDFRRTYNSLSTHDWFGTDGSQISNYGGGWTNTFDAHISLSTDQQTMSVYDIDGARYDYASDGQGDWIPPAGQYASLVHVGQQYQWTKTSGTAYQFYPAVPAQHGDGGRLNAIYGRNNNTSLNLVYAWNPDDSSPNNLVSISVYEDGVPPAVPTPSAVLTFTNVTINTSTTQQQTEDLLSSLKRPDGSVVNYYYAAQGGSLAEADRPVNNSEATDCPVSVPSSTGTCLPETYSYYSYSNQMYAANGPRSIVGDATGTGTGGGYISFQYSGNPGPISTIDHWGLMNPKILNDGLTASYLQPAVQHGTWNYRTTTFGAGMNSLQWTDTDGHKATYTLDSNGRVSQRQDWTGSKWLTKRYVWSTANLLTSVIDENSNEMDYAYDNSGDVVAEALPKVSNSDGNYRSTSLYSYDSYHNIRSYCDPEYVHNVLGADWGNNANSPPTVACPTTAGTAQNPGPTVMTWSTSSQELYGELSKIIKPMGYAINYTYLPSQESPGGVLDYGLPTQVAGALVPNQQNFWYDLSGRLIQYDKNTGGEWYLNYDTGGMGWLTKTTDPDNVSNYTVYDPNGTIAETQTALQHENSSGKIFTYDADSNQISETRLFGCVAPSSCPGAPTTKWYDGADRVVEVTEAWSLRYVYDLSSGGQVSISGMTSQFSAYGNQFDTQEYNASSQAWADTKGAAYDAVDRTLEGFRYQPCVAGTSCSSESPSVTTNNFDGTAQLGLLSSINLSMTPSTTASDSYDAANRKISVVYNDNGRTPTKTFTFDGDGRVTKVQSAGTFNGTEMIAYDADGEKISDTQPLADGSSAQLSYQYDSSGDGLKTSVAVKSTSWMPTNTTILSWAHRGDGLTTGESTPNLGLGWGYTPAGRENLYTDGSYSMHRSYDPQNGDLTSWDVAQGTYSNIVHDYEGLITQFTAYGSQTMLYQHDNIGELTTSQVNPGLADPVTGAQEWPQTKTTYSNSLPTPYQCNGFGLGQCQPHGTYPADFRNAVSLGISNYAPQTECETGPPVYCSWSLTKTLGFDSAGRQTSGSSNYTDQYACYQGGQFSQCSASGSGSFTATYDAENRLLGKVYTNWTRCPSFSTTVPPVNSNNTTAYIYGPSGHPISVGVAGAPSDNVVWDGDKVLLTEKSGFVDDIKLGYAADVGGLNANSGVSVSDREPGGALAGNHNSTGYSAWYPGLPNYQCWPGALPQNAPQASPNFTGLPTSASLSEPGTDGYSDGDVTFQGSRTYDPQTSQWTTPDASSGEVSHPMSQKPYAWNRNNAVDYSDASGFAPQLRPELGGDLDDEMLLAMIQGPFDSVGSSVADFGVNIFEDVADAIDDGMTDAHHGGNQGTAEEVAATTATELAGERYVILNQKQEGAVSTLTAMRGSYAATITVSSSNTARASFTYQGKVIFSQTAFFAWLPLKGDTHGWGTTYRGRPNSLMTAPTPITVHGSDAIQEMLQAGESRKM